MPTRLRMPPMAKKARRVSLSEPLLTAPLSRVPSAAVRTSKPARLACNEKNGTEDRDGEAAQEAYR